VHRGSPSGGLLGRSRFREDVPRRGTKKRKDALKTPRRETRRLFPEQWRRIAITILLKECDVEGRKIGKKEEGREHI